MDTITRNEQEQQKRRDHDDLQNEYAGRETGRMQRFLTREDRLDDQRHKEKKQRETRTLLELLMASPAYRHQFEKVTIALSNAQAAADDALSYLEDAIASAESALTELQEDAARLPDGTRVYRDADGVVRREDGTAVDDVLAATILWRGDEPGFEEFRASRGVLTALQAEHEDVLRFQNTVLGPSHDALNNPNDPPTFEELQEILEGVHAEMPAAVKDHMPASTDTAPTTTESSQNVSLPNLEPASR